MMNSNVIMNSNTIGYSATKNSKVLSADSHMLSVDEKAAEVIAMLSKEGVTNWRGLEPKIWETRHYVDFMRELGLGDIMFDLYNSTYVDYCQVEVNGIYKYIKKSRGFHPCTGHASRAFAIESKWKLHSCKFHAHRGQRHSILVEDIDSPRATWICPQTNVDSTGVFRYTDGTNYIPITFSNVDDILKRGRKLRVWYWELSLYNNNERNKGIFSQEILKNVDEHQAQWNKVISHPFIFEADATKMDNKRRRNILAKEVYLEAMNDFIGIVNDFCIKDLGLSIDNWEWLFSGNGLYWVGNGILNSVMLKNKREKMGKDVGWTNNMFFNKQLYTWARKQDILSKIIKEKNIKYINIDEHLQYMREFIKTPFSLHSKFDRPCLPLTCLFGGNAKIDLTSELFLNMMEPKNLTKEIVKKYFRKEEYGIETNNFLNF